MARAYILLEDRQMRERVGRNIALLRTSRSFTLSNWVNLYPRYLTSPGKLSNWERGIHMTSLHFLLKLCDDHDLTLEWFIRAERDRLPESVFLKRDQAENA